LPEGTENFPVTEISWHDAMGFAEWASKRIGEPLRLPLEEEWYRAGHGMGKDWKKYRYPWGEDALRYACNNLNFWGEIDVPRPQTVDYRYSQRDGTTPEGLWAMSGNAAEWAMNWIAEKRDNGTPDDPTDDFFVPQLDPEARADAPTMGGSFLDGIGDCTVDSYSVRRLDKRTRRVNVGFRLWMPSFDVLR
ncbi:MAG: formylglycine-generating enzyme family protein, partial [Planctomycetota bacterium]